MMKVNAFVRRAMSLIQIGGTIGGKNVTRMDAQLARHHSSASEDGSLALKNLKAASEQGHAHAQFKLALRLETSDSLLEKDLNSPKYFKDDMAEAVRLYKLAAAQGHAGAQHHLGLCYQFGKGVAMDRGQAVRLFKLASDQGLSEAHICLGVAYFNGDGVTQDVIEGTKYVKMAAAQGDAVALSYLRQWQV